MRCLLASLLLLAPVLPAQTQLEVTPKAAASLVSKVSKVSKYTKYRQQFVFHEGQWRRRSDVAKAVKVEREVKRRKRLLESWYSKTRDSARNRLVALAKEHGRPRLRYEAERLHAAYSRYWDHVWRARRAQRYGLLGISAQNVSLLGMDTVPVSLGVGNPVTLQLPRTRSVSIGTTVLVPLGR